MARIAGIDLPTEKRIVVALTYIYGIGPATAKKLLASAGISQDIRVKNLSDEDAGKLRTLIEREYKGGRLAAQRNGHEHQAPDGHRRLSWTASPPQPARSRPAHEDQRAYA